METEILVHVSAPSCHDARYRAQVAAILGSMRSPDACDPTDRPAHDRPRSRSRSKSPEVISLTSSCSISSAGGHHLWELPNSGEELRGAFSTLSSSSEHEGGRPGPAQEPDIFRTSAIKSGHADSLGSLISVIPDSQPDDLPRFEAVLPLQPATAEYSSPPNQRSPALKRRRVDPSSCAPGYHADSAAQTESSSSTKEQSTLHQTGRSKDDGNRDQPYTPFPTTTISTSIPTTIEASNSVSAPTSPSTSPSAPASPSANYIQLTSLPLELHPPPPPIATAQFTTHITPTLSMLADRLKPARTYKPTTQTRALNNLERGQWVLHINVIEEEEHGHQQTQKQKEKEKVSLPRNRNDWTPALFHRFWTFLAEFICRDGRAGWGVWCILEQRPSPQQSNAPDSNICPNDNDNDAGGAGNGVDDDQLGPPATPLTLKLYAWGEVAMHVYLLLFLASERRVKGMRAQWKDAREETVIVMP